jgi:hypothetical protein
MQDMTAVGLLERRHELRQLDRLVEDAHDRRGRMVLVEGAPGIGKTRLLDAGRDRARETDMVVLSARASELDREFPFGVVRQLFEPLVSGADRGRREELLHGAAGLAAPLLGQGSPGHELTSGGPDASLTLFHALYWLTSNLSDAAPVLLAIDDLH